MIGTSAALTLSGVPFFGPIGACRVILKMEHLGFKSWFEEMEETDSDLVVAGTREGVLMVESQAKELLEEIVLGSVMFGHEQFQPVINAIISMAESSAKEPWSLPETPEGQDDILKKALKEKRKSQFHK